MELNLIQQIKAIKDLIEKSNSRQSGFHDWILNNGKSFKGRKLTEEEEKELSEVLGSSLYKPKYCYYTCQMISILSDYDYYEGYGHTEKIGLNLEHSWLVKNNTVFDPTWKDGAKYFGINIPKEFVRENIFKTSMAEALIIRYYFERIINERD